MRFHHRIASGGLHMDVRMASWKLCESLPISREVTIDVFDEKINPDRIPK